MTKLTTPRLLCFAASLRGEASLNRKLLQRTIATIGDAAEIDAPDYASICPPLFRDVAASYDTLPPEARLFVDKLRDCDGMIASVPEYNGSIPASFKNLIDWVSCLRPYPLAGIPIWLLCATPSRRGGVMGVTQSRVPLEYLGAQIFAPSFALGDAHSAFTPEGDFINEMLQTELTTAAQAYVEFARKLR